LQDGLELFDRVRGPHYQGLYGILDRFAEADAYLKKSNLGFDDAVNVLVERKWNKKYKWVTEYDVQQVLKDALER